MVFGTEQEFNMLTTIDKEKNFFIFNRMMGIKFPKQANYFNSQDVNKSDVITFWRGFILAKYNGSYPKFLYTKSKGKDAAKYWEPNNKEEYKKYLEFYNYTRKDFQDASILDLEGTKKSFKEFQNMLK